MKNYIKAEFKRGFFSKRNKIAIIICFLSMVLYDVQNLFGIHYNVDASSLFTDSMTEIIKLIAPILVCLPFADSYLNDVDFGTLKYLYTKITPFKYGVTKILVNGILGGLVVLIGASLSFLVFLTKGIHVSEAAFINEELINVYNKSPFGYIVLVIFFMFIFGFVFSTLCLGISTILKNKYISILFPFIYCIVSATVLTKISYNLNAMRLFSISKGTVANVLFYDFILFIIGVLLFLTKILRRGDVIE